MTALLTDLYQLTMMQAYLEFGDHAGPLARGHFARDPRAGARGGCSHSLNPGFSHGIA